MSNDEIVIFKVSFHVHGGHWPSLFVDCASLLTADMGFNNENI